MPKTVGNMADFWQFCQLTLHRKVRTLKNENSIDHAKPRVWVQTFGRYSKETLLREVCTVNIEQNIKHA